ncbi:T9SS type A sorting domain-containing protein [Flavobacterium sp.]|uniref:T9SS type A sorting domain-containing protein n=1 Tax=Flavobacterium sp. TaxID=239 RepID=UPI00262B6786|nr:T9SS type A sorting domain-containing protein [Flavobacterium sp.]
MKTIYIFCFFLCSLQTFAQTNEDRFQWSFNTGGGRNSVNRIRYDSQGNLLMLGNFNDIGKIGGTVYGTQNTNLFSTQYLAKRTPAGVITIYTIRAKVLGGFGFNYMDFNLDANDNVFLVGSKEENATPMDWGNGISITGGGYFITKFNNQGIAQWSHVVPDSPVSNSFNTPGIGCLPNGDVIFGGHAFNSPLWLYKYASDGTYIATKTYSITGANTYSFEGSINGLNFDANGNSYFFIDTYGVTSLTINGTDVINTNNTNSYNSFILNFNSNGDKKEFFLLKGRIEDLAVDKNSGNVFYKTYITDTTNTAPFNQITLALGFLYKGVVLLNNLNQYIKHSTFLFFGDPPIYPGLAYSICPLSSETYVYGLKHSVNSSTIITMGSQSYTMPQTEDRYFYIESDSNLNNKNFVTAPTLSTSSSLDDVLLANYNSKVAVSGRFAKAQNPTISINGTTLTACDVDTTYGTRYPSFAGTESDIFYAEYVRPEFSLSTNETIAITNEVVVYPNPSSGIVNFKSKNNQSLGNMEVYDALGRTVLEITTTDFETTITLERGLYFVSIKNENGTTNKKVIIN